MIERRGFTLMETVTALALLAFCGVALLGLLPLALGQMAANRHETRAVALASTFFATLRAGPYEAVPCFGRVLDLGAADGQGPPVLWYAAFPEDAPPEISTSDGGQSRCVIELRLEPVTAAGVDGAAVRALLSVRPREGGGRVEALRFESVVNPR